MSDLSDRHTPWMFHIGDVIRKLRMERGWNQEELGRAADINKETVVRIEAGLPARTDSLERIADAFGRRLAELYGLTEASGDAMPDAEPTGEDVSDGYEPDDIPMIAEGDASPQPGLFWDDDGTLRADVEDRISRPHDVTDPRAYGVKVRGDSMAPIYRAGMKLVVSPNTAARDGDEVYVMLLNGERLLKIARKVPGGWMLESANPAYESRFVKKSEIGAMHPIIWSRRQR